MKKEILTQEEDDLEKEMRAIEQEEAETKEKKLSVQKRVEETVEETNETYENFMQPARMGIANTVTGEIIEGFTPGKDDGIVQLGKVILNKLDKIGIVSGV